MRINPGLLFFAWMGAVGLATTTGCAVGEKVTHGEAQGGEVLLAKETKKVELENGHERESRIQLSTKDGDEEIHTETGTVAVEEKWQEKKASGQYQGRYEARITPESINLHSIADQSVRFLGDLLGLRKAREVPREQGAENTSLQEKEEANAVTSRS